MQLSRRDFLKYAGITGTAITGGYIASQSPAIVRGQTLAGSVARGASPDFDADVDLVLLATEDQQQILDGPPTKVWRYEGELITGEVHNLQPLVNSFLGTTIRTRTGQKVRIRFKNELPESSNVHWHGLKVPDYADGHQDSSLKMAKNMCTNLR